MLILEFPTGPHLPPPVVDGAQEKLRWCSRKSSAQCYGRGLSVG